VLLAAAGVADIDDPADVTAVAAHARTSLDQDLRTHRAEFLQLHRQDPEHELVTGEQLADLLAYNALQAAEAAVGDYQRSALARLARSPQATAEAERAHEAKLRRHWWHPEGETAHTAATQAAEAARERTAQHLLKQRMQQLRTAETTTGTFADCGARPVHTEEVSA
jgi:hypothetical protein